MPPPPGKGKNASKDPKPDAVPGDKVEPKPEATNVETGSAEARKESISET